MSKHDELSSLCVGLAKVCREKLGAGFCIIVSSNGGMVFAGIDSDEESADMADALFDKMFEGLDDGMVPDIGSA